MKPQSYVFLMAFWCIHSYTFCQVNIDIHQSQTIQIAPKSTHWIDTTAALNYEQIIANPSISFLPHTANAYDMGFGDVAIWVKFHIKNTKQIPCLFEISNSNLDSIDVYIRTPNQKLIEYHTGDDYPFSSRFAMMNRFVFELPYQDCTVYLRVKSHTILFFALSAGDYRYAMQTMYQTYLVHGLYFGMVIIIAFYALLSFARLGERLHFLYFVYVLANGIIVAYENGYGLQWLWNGYPIFHDYPMLIYFWSVLGITFSTEFLQTKRRTPVLHQFFYLIYGAYVLILVLDLMSYHAWSSVLFRMVALSGALYAWAVATYILLTNLQNTFIRLYFIAWTGYISCVVIYILAVSGIIPYFNGVQNIIQIGVIWEIVLLAWAIVERVRLVKLENDLAQSKLLESLHENKRILEEQNQILDAKVTERTAALESQKKEMYEQNILLLAQEEELRQQNDEVEAQRDQLYLQNLLIESQKTSLEELLHNLEKVVAERTKHLAFANQELSTQNRQLEEFAYITAHNFRAPIARLIGLANLVRDTDNPNEIQTITQYIHTTTLNLDEVIKDMNKILDIQKNTSFDKDFINIKKQIELVKKALQFEIIEANAIIALDDTQSEIYAYEEYIYEILFQLISNALKYREPRRDTKIIISSTLIEGKHQLAIQDNGLGMNLDVFKDKIFHLYQKYHLHQVGKGFGLYLVKNQVEAMQGIIDIESKLDEGTTFYISLPIKY